MPPAARFRTTATFLPANEHRSLACQTSADLFPEQSFPSQCRAARREHASLLVGDSEHRWSRPEVCRYALKVPPAIVEFDVAIRGHVPESRGSNCLCQICLETQ